MFASNGPFVPPALRGSIRSYFGNSAARGYWDLSIDARDTSGNSNHLTEYGSPGRTPFGPFGRTCYTFDGSTGDPGIKVLRLVSPPDSISVRGLTECSVSLWVWPWTAPSANASLYAEFNNTRGTGRFSIFQLSTGVLQAFVRPTVSPGTAYVINWTSFTDNCQGKWTHIFFTHFTTATGGFRKLYVNGVQVGQENTANVGAFTTELAERITIGGHDIGSSGSTSCNARIAEVAVFHRRVTEKEITGYYNWCTQPSPNLTRVRAAAHYIAPPLTHTRSLRRFGTRPYLRLGSMTQFFGCGVKNDWVAHPTDGQMFDLRTGIMTTATNAPTRNGTQRFGFPGVGASYSFNNTYGTGAAFFNVPVSGATSLKGMRSGTIMLWYSYTGAPSSTNGAIYQESASASYPATTRFGLWLSYPSGLLLAAYRAVSGASAISFNEPDNAWRYSSIRGWSCCAMTFDSATNTAIVYKNGARVASYYDNAVIIPIEDVDPNCITIGGWLNTSNTAANQSVGGGVAEIGVFQRALTSKEIFDYYRWVTSFAEDRVNFMRYTFKHPTPVRGVILRSRRSNSQYGLKGDIRSFAIG